MKTKTLNILRKFFIAYGVLMSLIGLTRVGTLVVRYVSFHPEKVFQLYTRPTILEIANALFSSLSICALLFLFASVFEALGSQNSIDEKISTRFCNIFALSYIGMGIVNVITVTMQAISAYRLGSSLFFCVVPSLEIYIQNGCNFLIAYAAIYLHKNYFHLINFEKEVI
jgi:hypothetical protein